jgi:hypothetical protein
MKLLYLLTERHGVEDAEARGLAHSEATIVLRSDASLSVDAAPSIPRWGSHIDHSDNNMHVNHMLEVRWWGRVDGNMAAGPQSAPD